MSITVIVNKGGSLNGVYVGGDLVVTGGSISGSDVHVNDEVALEAGRQAREDARRAREAGRAAGDASTMVFEGLDVGSNRITADRIIVGGTVIEGDFFA